MRPLVIIVFAAAAIMAGDAEAQPTPDPLGRVYACADITEEAQRLACFDAAVAALRAADDQGDFVSADRTQVEILEREAFGFSLPSLPRLFSRDGGGAGTERAGLAGDDPGAAGVDSITAAVADLATRPDGRLVFTLANGQVWAQVAPDRMGFVREGDEVTIRRASLGSFFLSPPTGRGARVRREE
jgi:hypothetical protein